MRFIIISVFVIFLNKIIYSQTEIKTKYDTYLISDSTLLINQYINGEKNGLWKKKYINGNIKEIQFYKKGEKNGIVYRFYYSGKIKYKGEYLFNKKNDWFIYYIKKHNGVWRKKIKYQKGVKVGMKLAKDEDDFFN